MEVIWKYELAIKDIQKIEMPLVAEILTAQMQGDTLVLWALVNPESEKEYRTIEVIGTGNHIHSALTISRIYISTFQIGSFVGHVFEYTGGI